MTDTQIEKSIDEATSRCAGIIIRTIKNIYGEDEDFNLIRRSVLASLGNQGLSTELKFIFIAAFQNLSLQAQIKKEHEL